MIDALVIVYAGGASMTLAWIAILYARGHVRPGWRDVRWAGFVAALWPLVAVAYVLMSED